MYAFDEMRDLAIDEIYRCERTHVSDDGWSYYARWLAGLERWWRERPLLRDVHPGPVTRRHPLHCAAVRVRPTSPRPGRTWVLIASNRY
jgi:hypothetical protein